MWAFFATKHGVTHCKWEVIVSPPILVCLWMCAHSWREQCEIWNTFLQLFRKSAVTKPATFAPSPRPDHKFDLILKSIFDSMPCIPRCVFDFCRLETSIDWHINDINMWSRKNHHHYSSESIQNQREINFWRFEWRVQLKLIVYFWPKTKFKNFNEFKGETVLVICEKWPASCDCWLLFKTSKSRISSWSYRDANFSWHADIWAYRFRVSFRFSSSFWILRFFD